MKKASGRTLPFHNPFGRSSPTSSTSSLEIVDGTEPPSNGKKGGKRRGSERLSADMVRPSLNSKNSVDKRHSKAPPAKPAHFETLIESPPLVMYGRPEDSSGALLSGLLKLHVTAPEVDLERFEMRLVASTGTKKPVASHCADCLTRTNDLQKWEFVKEKASFKNGVHAYPFSYLLGGHLPATTAGALGSIGYSIVARAVTSAGEEIKYEQPIELKRAMVPGHDRHSIRIFPPTNLSARIVLPQIVHPIGEFPIEMQLDGIISKEKRTRWRLRKLSWRIDEHSRIVSPACKAHAQKLGGDGKGMLHEDVRTIGSAEIKSGWKSDFESSDGRIEMDFKAAIQPAFHPACDVDSPSGLVITHNLVLELIVAEEHCPSKNSRLSTPTGAARVLRMQFNTIVTERSGLGISWDEETPPLYDDVPASPPSYAQMEDFDVSTLDNGELLESL